MENQQNEMIQIYLNDNDCIVIKYNGNGKPNMHSITPQNIIEYCNKNSKKDIANSIIKQEVNHNQYELKYTYIFNKKVVLIGEAINYKKEITKEFKVNISFNEVSNFYTIFKYDVSLQQCNFSKDVIFSRCIFEGDMTIFDCCFRQKVDFGATIFKKGFSCISVNFCNQIGFHNTTFDDMPLFASTCFENPQMVDLIIAKTKHKIEDIKMPKEYIDKIKTIRDSYRAIKNILITQNNLLEASYWHKLELYTKEVELKNEKPKIFSKEWIDLWQLKLYRLTSNHHTDLLKSFNSLIILIGIFALFGLCIVAGFNKYCGFYDTNPHIMIEFYNIHIKNYAINNALIVFAFNAILTILFIWLFLVCQMCYYVRNIAIYLCYILTCALLFSSPKYLIPAIGIVTDKRMIFDPLAVNGGLYTIFFGFMVYSFIKTARKNAIIPI